MDQCYTGTLPGGRAPTFPPGFSAADRAPLCTAPEAAQTSCVHQKRYCHPDPDGQAGFGANGRNALEQLIRQKCVGQVCCHPTSIRRMPA